MGPGREERGGAGKRHAHPPTPPLGIAPGHSQPRCPQFACPGHPRGKLRPTEPHSRPNKGTSWAWPDLPPGTEDCQGRVGGHLELDRGEVRHTIVQPSSSSLSDPSI